MDPASQRPICFSYNRGLLENDPLGGCPRAADECRFAHVPLNQVPGAEDAAAILAIEVSVGALACWGLGSGRFDANGPRALRVTGIGRRQAADGSCLIFSTPTPGRAVEGHGRHGGSGCI